MKCRDCSIMCIHRSSNVEQECFYSQPQSDTLPTALKTYTQVDEEKHWQDVRERAAIAAMQILLEQSRSPEVVSKNAVAYADALVKELKGE